MTLGRDPKFRVHASVKKEVPVPFHSEMGTCPANEEEIPLEHHDPASSDR
jgi:hypothetical protein